MLIKLNNTVKFVIDFVSRNLVWILGFLVPLYLIGFQAEYIKSLLLTVATIYLLTGIAGTILYAFTVVKFSRLIVEGENGKLDPTERYALMGLAGKIFQGVLISGSVIWAIIYLSQFSGF